MDKVPKRIFSQEFVEGFIGDTAAHENTRRLITGVKFPAVAVSAVAVSAVAVSAVAVPAVVVPAVVVPAVEVPAVVVPAVEVSGIIIAIIRKIPDFFPRKFPNYSDFISSTFFILFDYFAESFNLANSAIPQFIVTVNIGNFFTKMKAFFANHG
jgi:hypothetical protein